MARPGPRHATHRATRHATRPQRSAVRRAWHGRRFLFHLFFFDASALAGGIFVGGESNALATSAVSIKNDLRKSTWCIKAVASQSDSEVTRALKFCTLSIVSIKRNECAYINEHVKSAAQITLFQISLLRNREQNRLGGVIFPIHCLKTQIPSMN